jgi:hypothetical protein
MLGYNDAAAALHANLWWRRRGGGPQARGGRRPGAAWAKAAARGPAALIPCLCSSKLTTGIPETAWSFPN